MNNKLASVTFVIAGTLLLSCSSNEEPGPNTLKPFSSDGCSLFPDSLAIARHDWCDCCFQHDIAYWRGGTEVQREEADLQLRQCVIDKTDNRALSTLMYEGVRLGGSPFFHTWYRWGYGWTKDRQYQSLNSVEETLADRLMADYQSSEPESVCVAQASK